MSREKFLKVSRLIKRRTIANEACDAQRVEVNGRVVKASYDVKIGDVISIRLGDKVLKAEVTDIKEHALKNDAPLMYKLL